MELFPRRNEGKERGLLQKREKIAPCIGGNARRESATIHKKIFLRRSKIVTFLHSQYNHKKVIYLFRRAIFHFFLLLPVLVHLLPMAGK